MKPHDASTPVAVFVFFLAFAVHSSASLGLLGLAGCQVSVVETGVDEMEFFLQPNYCPSINGAILLSVRVAPAGSQTTASQNELYDLSDVLTDMLNMNGARVRRSDKVKAGVMMMVSTESPAATVPANTDVITDEPEVTNTTENSESTGTSEESPSQTGSPLNTTGEPALSSDAPASVTVQVTDAVPMTTASSTTTVEAAETTTAATTAAETNAPTKAATTQEEIVSTTTSPTTVAETTTAVTTLPSNPTTQPPPPVPETSPSGTDAPVTEVTFPNNGAPDISAHFPLTLVISLVILLQFTSYMQA